MSHLETSPRVSVHSVAGVGSCCYVESLDIAFDIGVCFGKAPGRKHVFVTHGHIDHIKALPGHAGERALCKASPATYYVPTHLVPHVQAILASFECMQEAAIPATIIGIEAGSCIRVSPRVVVKAFATHHRVPSLGYVAYTVTKRLHDDYKGLPPNELIALRKAKVPIDVEVVAPAVAYTGDTEVSFFEPHNDEHCSDFLAAPVLVTECTYVGDKTAPAKATARGHIHADQLVAIADRFRNEHLVLTHFSAQYSLRNLTATLTDTMRCMPPSVWLAHGDVWAALSKDEKEATGL
ncbi:nuclear ribonuclease Z [Achlya hypogyna]|uniref:Nuclear ribonuclease Z n=1 Tax=Achlya hypogyna TaxID=1202772 RepID=A0A1V9ZI15_ACHHY|nr:nuclear ribonuclease Z [Achlya hypogyna]